MKKLLTLTTILFLSSSASAQMHPLSMQGENSPSPQRTTIQPVTIPVQAQQAAVTTKVTPTPEAKGYSVAFIAQQYNEKCNLGISNAVIATLAGELQKAEQEQQITQATIDTNVAAAQKMHDENPTKFCAEAQQIASVIKGMFPGQ